MKWDLGTHDPGTHHHDCYGEHLNFIRDSFRGEGDGDHLDNFYDNMSKISHTPQEQTAEFMDAADVFMSYKQKTSDFEKDAWGGLLPAMARGAAGWGAAGGVMGALSAKKGERLKGFGKGLAMGAVGGVAAAPAELAMRKLLSRYPASSAARLSKIAQKGPDLPPELKSRIKDTAIHKFPSKEPIAKEVKGIWNHLKDMYGKWSARRSAMGSAPVLGTMQAKEASLGSTVGKMIPHYMKTPTGVGITAATAAAFGIGNYIANMPRESLGGKGKAQVHFEEKVRANQAAGEEGAGLSKRMANRMAEFQKDLATEFTRRPSGAAATGAAVGAGIGTQVARLVQGIR